MQLSLTESFVENGVECTLRHGDVLAASITSCTNTSSPLNLLMAGISHSLTLSGQSTESVDGRYFSFTLKEMLFVHVQSLLSVL